MIIQLAHTYLFNGLSIPNNLYFCNIPNILRVGLVPTPSYLNCKCIIHVVAVFFYFCIVSLILGSSFAQDNVVCFNTTNCTGRQYLFPNFVSLEECCQGSTNFSGMSYRLNSECFLCPSKWSLFETDKAIFIINTYFVCAGSSTQKLIKINFNLVVYKIIPGMKTSHKRSYSF